MILHIITEDNNTRVLFERVLSSGSSLEPEKSVYVYLYDIKNFTTLSFYYTFVHFTNSD